MCTKESKVIAKTKKCGCGEPRPESSIHIHTDFPLHAHQNAIVAPDTTDNAYYFDPFNEIDDFNMRIRQSEAHTLEYIPYKARKKFAKAIKDLITNVNGDPLNRSAHARLLAFPKSVLCNPQTVPKKGAKARKATTKAVIDNINLWSESERGKQIVLERLFDYKYEPASNTTDLTDGNIKRAKKLYHQLRFSDAASALTSEGTVKWSPEVLQKIKDKHPRAERPVIPVEAVPQALQVDEETVLRNLKSFPKGTGCGRDGLRAQHLLDAYRGAGPLDKEHLLSTITVFVNNMLRANSPKDLAKFYASAPIVPLAKENDDVRPIDLASSHRKMWI